MFWLTLVQLTCLSDRLDNTGLATHGMLGIALHRATATAPRGLKRERTGASPPTFSFFQHMSVFLSQRGTSTPQGGPRLVRR